MAANVNGTDVFGISKIYADDTSGNVSNWVMDMNNPGGDPRGNNPETSSYMPNFKKNNDGSWNISRTEIRWAITQDNGYDESKLCTNSKTCAQQGYMQDPKDWKDIEMTAYYRINQCGGGGSNGKCHIEHVMRGQRSTTSTNSVGVCGCALGCSDNYHGNSYPESGRQKWEKDLFHVAGYGNDIRGVNNNSATRKWDDGTWIGIKTICYNLENGTVRLEHWTDENANNKWKMTHYFIDDGKKWKVRYPHIMDNHCGAGTDPIAITWGGPLTVFRSDNIKSYDIKWASIRSIDSTKPLHPHAITTSNNRSLETSESLQPSATETIETEVGIGAITGPDGQEMIIE
jgi:hypothetical protein